MDTKGRAGPVSRWPRKSRGARLSVLVTVGPLVGEQFGGLCRVPACFAGQPAAMVQQVEKDLSTGTLVGWQVKRSVPGLGMICIVRCGGDFGFAVLPSLLS